MITTTLQIGKHTVIINDPADTPEKKAEQRKRIESACVRFWQDAEREAMRK